MLRELLLFPNKRVILYCETVNTGTYASAVTIFFILFYSIILMNKMSKNNIFNKYPPVIHGEARAENDEFVVHARYPRFLARKSFDDSFSGGLPVKKISGELVQAGEPRGLAYCSGIGLWLSDFIFLDNNRPEVTAEWLGELKAACDKITADDIMLSEPDGDLYD